MSKKRFLIFPRILLVVTFGLLGCSLGPKYVVKDYRAPARVAVLPFSNETNDVDGPEIVRHLFVQMLPERGYYPLDPKNVDEILRENFGITEGGQLNAVSSQDLGKALKVDALFYGNLITFMDLPFGFGRKRTVKANLKLVSCQTGSLLWEDEKSWTTPEIHLSAEEAKRAAVRQVAERQIEKMNGTFLRHESILMLKLALENLPTSSSLSRP